MSKVGGVNTFVLWAEESSYGTYTTPNKHFGINATFSGRATNNPIISRGLKGSSGTGREISKIKTGLRGTSCSVEFEPTDFEFLELVLGGDRGGSGTGASPYTYVLASTTKYCTISQNLDDSTDREEKYVGNVVTQMTLRCSVGEAVKVSLQFEGQTFTTDATLATNQSLPSGDVYTFDGGDIEWPDGTSLKSTNVIDSCTLTIQTGNKTRAGLGSTLPVGAVAKGVTVRLDFTMKDTNDTAVTNFLAGTSPGTVQLRFSNGSTKYIEFDLANAYPADYSNSSPAQEDYTEDHSVIGTSISAVERVSS